VRKRMRKVMWMMQKTERIPRMASVYELDTSFVNHPMVNTCVVNTCVVNPCFTFK
jgi:hypothetical protein